MCHNRLPHHPLRWFFRCARLSPNTKYRSDLITRRIAITTEQDHRWRSMTGNVSPRSVNHMGQVHTRKEHLDQLLPKLTLHERIGRNHPDVARTAAVL